MNYIARVKEKIETDRGKIKNQTAVYLIEDAVSVTDAEVYITQEYSTVGFDWELKSVTETNICKVLNASDRADRS